MTTTPPHHARLTAWLEGCRLFAALSLLLALPVRAATINPREINVIRSRSDQFIVTAVSPGTTSYRVTRRDFKYDPNALHLQSPALAVTCERVKNAVLRELGLTDKWTGHIYVALKPAATSAPEIQIRPMKYADGWQYHMEIPDQVDPQFLVSRLVEVVLLDLANRTSAPRSAEIPLWLIGGLTTQLLSTDGQSFVLQTQKLEDVRATTFPSTRMNDPLKEARARLGQQSGLSFADLCLPSQAQVNGSAWDTYRYSSQLLLSELLKLRDGQPRLQNFVSQLPYFLNSQLAFLRAYEGRFNSMLDVEKWWSVTVVNFSGRDQQLKWSPYVCLQRLDEILTAPVEIRASSNALPAHAELRLQNIFEKLDFTRQKVVLQTTIMQLQQLQWNAPPDMFKLVKDYHTALISYLQKRDKASGSDQKSGAGGAKLILRDTVRQLDLLDVIRDDFRKFDAPAAPAAQSASK